MIWIAAWTQGLDHLSNSPASKSTRATRNPSHNHPLPPLPPFRLHRTTPPPTHLPLVTVLSPLGNPCSPILREPTPAFDLWRCPQMSTSFLRRFGGACGRNPSVPSWSPNLTLRVIAFLPRYFLGPFSLYYLAFPFIRRCRFVSNTRVPVLSFLSPPLT